MKKMLIRQNARISDSLRTVLPDEQFEVLQSKCVVLPVLPIETVNRLPRSIKRYSHQTEQTNRFLQIKLPYNKINISKFFFVKIFCL